MSTYARPSKIMITMSVITLTLSSYNLFELFTGYGHFPTLLGALSIAGFDLAALGCAQHALVVARDGDSGAAWNLATVALAVLSSWLQYDRAALAGDPRAVGIASAAFPLVTVALFEGTIRRAHRLNGRASGRVAAPRATLELIQWLVFPRASAKAFVAAVADRTLGAEGAFRLGYLATRPVHTPPPPRRTVSTSVEQMFGLPAGIDAAAPDEHTANGAATGAAGSPNTGEDSPGGTVDQRQQDADVRPNLRAVPNLATSPPASRAELIRRLADQGITDQAEIMAAVRQQFGEVNVASVRSQIRQIIRQASGQGTGGYL